MNNKQEKEALLLELKRDLDFYKEAIKTVAEEVLKNDVSHYPIFIAHKEPINLGRQILSAEEHEAKWDISASVAEEFITKGIVKEDKTEEFKQIYKDPESHMCVFVADKSLSNFVFFPYS